jgi:phage terminase large subunit
VELWRSRLPELVISGPAGTGKSRACLEKLHFCALKYAGMRGLIVRKTRESLSEAALVTFEEKVLPAYSPLKDGPRRNFRQAYHYPNRSEVVVGGLDKPGKIMSTEYDMIYVQEATELEQEDWQALTTRLRNNVIPYQQLIADCNPDAPTHWLWVRAQSDALTMLHSRHEDNPRLFKRGAWTEEGVSYLATLDRLTGTEHARLRLGQWVQASGIVYDVWTDPGNVTEEAEYIPDGGDVVWAVDDGVGGTLDPATGMYTANSHPRVFLLVQIRNNGQICVFHEHYSIHTREDADIADVLSMPYPEPEYAVVDRSALALKIWIQDQGIGTYNGPGDVEESIKVLRTALAPDAADKRRVTVHPRCKHLRAEMASYRYDANGKPVKAFDHGPDALRYLVWRFRQM